MRSVLHAVAAGIDSMAFTFAIGAYLRNYRYWPIRRASWVGFLVGVPMAVGTALMIES